MVLDKFINSVRSKVAKKFGFKTNAEIDAFFIGMEESARDNQEALEKRDKMLRDTVAELCEAKRLLKAAVEDFNKSLGAMYTCPYCKYVEKKREVCASRKEQYCGDICEWRYADEALKLIEEDGEYDEKTI